MLSSSMLTGSYIGHVGPHSVPPAIVYTAWSPSDGSVGTSRALLELSKSISQARGK
jgi:hypothetical protein